MQLVRPLIRVIVSLVGAVIPLLFLSGSYSPLGSSALGSYLPNVLGSQSALYSSLQNSIGVSLPVGLLPFGAAGGTGLIVYTVVQRVLGGLPEQHTPRRRLTLQRCSARCKAECPG